MNFKTFLEAKQTYIDKIQKAIKKVDKRPFKELFSGYDDRFLVKVINPHFKKALEKTPFNLKDFDFEKRKYKNENINSALKQEREDIKTETTLRFKKFRDWMVSQIKQGEYTQEYAKGSLKIQLAEFRRNLEQEYKQRIANVNKVKQYIDQKNLYYYLVFSRNPIDVLRMSDHRGISSCHRLQGHYSSGEGDFADCALADASNDGGIVYLIKGSEYSYAKNHLNDDELFEDEDRKVTGIRPLGRIRLRRFIDLSTGKDVAIPNILQYETAYGYFTKDVYEIMMDEVRKRQKEFFSNPPDADYLAKNYVVVGGTYDDSGFTSLMNNFLGSDVLRYEKDQYINHYRSTPAGMREGITKAIKEHNEISPFKLSVDGNRIEIRDNRAIKILVRYTKLLNNNGNPEMYAYLPIGAIRGLINQNFEPYAYNANALVSGNNLYIGFEYNVFDTRDLEYLLGILNDRGDGFIEQLNDTIEDYINRYNSGYFN